MKTLFHLIIFWLVFQGYSTLEWNQLVKKSGSTIYACLNDDVIFPYLFDLSESESIVSLVWSYHRRGDKKVLGTLLNNEFLIAPAYHNRVILKKDGSFSMQKVRIRDTGDYILKIKTSNNDQNNQAASKEFSLVVSEKLMYTKNKIRGQLSDTAEWNSKSKSFFLSLTCGDFIFKNDNAPLDMEWILPDGSVRNSTKYNDGKFYLRLNNPVQGGKYICKIPDASLSMVCATSKDNSRATVDVNEDRVRVIFLESEIGKFKETMKTQNKKMKNQEEKMHKQEEQIREHNANVQKQSKEISQLQARSKKNCNDWKGLPNGKRKIYLTYFNWAMIYCEQSTEGGRWNVFQRRQDGSVDFYRGWSDYRNGFGDPDGEFWLGLETLHQMTNNGKKYELRFDLVKPNGWWYYAVYDDFYIRSEKEGYSIHVSHYIRGNAGDSFSHHSNMKFTTKDRDQDNKNGNCALLFKGGWWYNACFWANLNGLYNSYEYGKGINWYKLTGNYASLKKTEMKFREKL